MSQVNIYFDDNTLLPLLHGEHSSHIKRIEEQLSVSIAAKGNVLTIGGDPEAVGTARVVLDVLWERLKHKLPVDEAEIDATIHISGADQDEESRSRAISALTAPDMNLRTRRKIVGARTANQQAYIESIKENDLVFAIGPAGTGKTYLAVAHAVAMFLEGKVSRLILSRPAIEAGERLGFLPGDMREKVDPYLRPIYDALYEMLGMEQTIKYIEAGDIEIAPLAYMRGRTLSEAFVLLDEAQNTTATQMKMALTRLGERSRMIVTGDISQIDLPAGTRSGLKHARDILDGVEGIGFITFNETDVVRHRLVNRIVKAYDRHETKTALPRPVS
ncbi:MAG: PhoH family protein [Pseudomonadota bacterium]|nr:PhoH family protein [Pseudomonadota bacterium]